MTSTASPSQSYAADRTHWRSPEVSPLHQYSCRLRLQNHVRPVVEGAAQGLGVHPGEHQDVPGRASCTIAATSPLSSKAHPAELLVGEPHRRSVHKYSPVPSSRRSEATAGMSRSRKIT